MKGHFFFFQGDELGLKDKTIVWRHKEQEQIIPIHQVKALHIMSDLKMNRRFFGLLNQYRIPVFFYSYYGNPIGQFIPSTKKTSGQMYIAQMQHYIDEEKRLCIAKNILKSTEHNMIAVLSYYRKRHKLECPSISVIEKNTESIQTKSTLKTIMSYEANAKRAYYSEFDKILRFSRFQFQRRSYRPPRNEVNTTMSFTYHLLYTEISTLLLQTRLVSDIAFLHSTNQRSNSLVFDIAEIYKPILCDRTMFRLFNRQMMRTDDFFQKENGTVYLTTDGMKKITTEFQQQLEQVITIEKRFISYRHIILKDLYKLQSYLLGKRNTFEPFVSKW